MRALFAILMLLTQLSWGADIVLVSDIDDTIKVSHVLDIDSVIANSMRIGNVFRGMADLYSLIQNSHPESPFYYLSNAPHRGFHRIHELFIQTQKFPAGEILLRHDLRNRFHKVQSLRKIISEAEPKVVLLVGDNGERDPAVYDQIVREYPKIQFFTFIRQVYSGKNQKPGQRGMSLFPGQYGFVTPIEISMRLESVGILPKGDTEKISVSYIPLTLLQAQFEDEDGERGELSFPNWQDCRDFSLPAEMRDFGTKLIEDLVARIEMRCSRPQFDN